MRPVLFFFRDWSDGMVSSRERKMTVGTGTSHPFIVQDLARE